MSNERLRAGDLVPRPPKPKSEDEIIARWKGRLDKPVVSICCIAYNHEDFIEDALNSFLAQIGDIPFEVLIHDDASSDHTPQIIREYVSEFPRIIKPIFQSENQFSRGVSPNIRFNFPRAKGEYIALCEGDDFWISHDKLKKQLNAFQENPDCVMCYHDAKKVDEENNVIGLMVPGQKKYLSKNELAKAPFTPTLTRMFRNVGFSWEKESELPIAMDVCLAAYLSKFGGAVYLGNDVLSAYRIHGAGVWSLKGKYQKVRMTVDSRLYIAAHFKIERDDEGSDQAFVYHMSSAAEAIYDNLPFLTALKSISKYILSRALLSIRKVLVRLVSIFRIKVWNA